MVKTIFLSGTEVKVSGPDGDNAEIHNFGSGIVYASKFPNIAANADNVIAVASGAIDGLTGTHGVVYLLGTGKVQVNFTDEKITKTAAAAVQSAASGGGTGVSEEYVAEKDAETLAAAQQYANIKTAEALESAREYTESAINAIEIGGRNYLLNSAEPHSLTGTGDTGVADWSASYYLCDGTVADFVANRYLQENQDVTFSFDCEVSNTGDAKGDFTVAMNSAPWQGIRIDISKISSPCRIAAYLKVQQSWRSSIASGFILRLYNVTEGVTVTVKNIKLEIGNKATDWTPAIEDFTQAAMLSELNDSITSTNSDIYGLEIDYENGVFTRLAGAVDKTAGTDFDCIRAYGGRRRCNISDSGEVLAYYGEENFKTDGSNGQVMVEQPRFYYKAVPLKAEKINDTDGYYLHKARYYISDTPKAGFKVHPAFVRNGAEVDRIYLSAFEGCIYDSSAETYLLNDEQTADFNADKLSSIAGAVPCSGRSQELTITNARKLAQNRGNGWMQATIQSVSATQLLFLIENAAFNSQKAIDSGSSKEQSLSYRGEDDLCGSITFFADGVINNSDCSLCIADCNCSSTDFGSSCLDTKFTFPDTGYASSYYYSEKFDWVFIPGKTTGNSAVPTGSYVINGEITGSGAISFGGSNNGAFAIQEDDANRYGNTHGCRLLYCPQTN